MSEIALRCAGICKAFEDGIARVEVLNGVDLVVQRGRSVGLLGASGSGKSTLMHILGGLERPDQGHVELAGQSMTDSAEKDLALLRNQHLGFVYQFHHLLSEFSALENVAMPMRIGGASAKVAQDRASELLTRVGLAERARNRPRELSGGERQRVAIARALINEPVCVLADEPTGNLDRANADAVTALMLELVAERGSGLLLATHDEAVAKQLDGVVRLEAGRLG
ncbi:MAG: ABC transporter ATP-binding protein [Pseudomonadota bacterium]